MATKTDIKPSPEARRLFGRMVARSDNLCLTLTDTIALQVDLNREGAVPHTQEALAELTEEQWVGTSTDGGWTLH